ncbi:biotin synthase [Thermococcus sp. M36]|uniref:DUF257 family protein n=1 Tax=Thermococcus sp. M36 TaxID=1638261 RepID=UPI00143A01DE|nr:DUF257 family protein [Thermococcus sp. M36]NJE05225.1 biotin synthase [Thermococcus sp. M36]
MMYPLFDEYLFGKINRGDIVLIEYPSLYPIEEFSWGFVIPLVTERDGAAVGDFFGVGNILFKNYVRRLSGKKYRELIEMIKRIKVVKIGPGSISYGEVIEEVVPTYSVQSFLKNYYSVINRIGHLPTKPGYFLTFGLGHYIHFGGSDAMKAILTGLSTIPMEEWATIHFINEDLISREHLAMLEEISSVVFYVSNEGLTVKKGGDAIDSGG